MERITLESGLHAYRCPTTGGHYITTADYMGWLQQQPARLPHLPKTDFTSVLTSKQTSALICPESGTIMQRFKVGHGFEFAIDRSIAGGVWLDNGEWEALKERNFHDEIHLVFTAPWQKHVREDQAQEAYYSMLKSTLGIELFERLDALKTELADHPQRNPALAFLTEH